VDGPKRKPRQVQHGDSSQEDSNVAVSTPCSDEDEEPEDRHHDPLDEHDAVAAGEGEVEQEISHGVRREPGTLRSFTQSDALL